MARTRSADRQQDIHVLPSNRLILCFDGTGNKFQGTPGDTNIVKLYNMLDRTNTSQMHYYQPGIGTYPPEGPVNVGWFRTLIRKIEAVIDAGLATSFDSHVIAGYKFIMRYYKPGDRIYIFGFSRGAFTARFLARMISHVGLLSMGNEELVPFAYQVYQEYEQNRPKSTKDQEEHVRYMNSFKNHFCRTERDAAKEAGADISANESGIKVHFLGLFDCVSSVGNLDIPFFQKTPPLPAVRGTAEHVRHAVAIDERRVKFKAALFSQEQNAAPEDIKEVWFPGNHGDVGGGWDVPDKEDGTAHDESDDDYFQLSDIALKWMVDEIDNIEVDRRLKDRFAWDPDQKAGFLRRFEKNKDEMIEARMHDTMTWNGGSDSGFKVLLWNFMELIPWVIKRWEYVESPKNSKKYEWKYIGWPPNLGGRRDIPSTALFHDSVLRRMRLWPNPKSFRPKLYLPNNPLWVRNDSAQPNKRINKAAPAIDEVGAPEPLETNLKKLAEQESPNAAASPQSERYNGERQPLAEQRLHFAQVDRLATGSIEVEGQRGVVVGVQDEDRVYRAAIGAKPST